MQPADIEKLATLAIKILSGPVSGLLCAAVVAYVSTRSWHTSVSNHIKTLEGQILKIQESHTACEKRCDTILTHLLLPPTAKVFVNAPS